MQKSSLYPRWFPFCGMVLVSITSIHFLPFSERSSAQIAVSMISVSSNLFCLQMGSPWRVPPSRISFHTAEPVDLEILWSLMKKILSPSLGSLACGMLGPGLELAIWFQHRHWWKRQAQHCSLAFQLTILQRVLFYRKMVSDGFSLWHLHTWFQLLN